MKLTLMSGLGRGRFWTVAALAALFYVWLCGAPGTEFPPG